MFNLSAVLNLTGVNTASVDSTMNQLNSRMRTTTKTAENLADAVALKGMSLVPYTIASAAILKMSEAISRATRDAIKFESEVAKIAQTLNISNKQAAQQTKFIGKLSRDFGLSAPKIAETARVLAQAGEEFENIATLEKAVTALTQSTLLASFEDLTETTDGLIAATRQFKEEAKDAGKVIALVNVISKRYAVEAGDLFEAVRKAGGAFSATGGKLKDLLALFTTIRDTTRESAESISVGLRTITARLQRPATVNFFDKIGISLRDAKGEFVGTLDAIQTIQRAIADKGINPKSLIFSQIVEQLGGVLQQSRVIPLLLEGTKLTKILAEAEKAEAEAAADAAKQQEALAFKIAQTQQNIAALFREISESQGFKLLADSALGLTNALVELVRVGKDAIPLLALLGGASLAGSALKRTSGVGISKGARLAAYGTGAAAYAFAGGFNSGGKIPGSGYGDKMQILAEPGEFMIKRTRAQEIGYPTLHALNAGQIDLPGYMSGGVIGDDSDKQRKIADLRARIMKYEEKIISNSSLSKETRKAAEIKAAALRNELRELADLKTKEFTSTTSSQTTTNYDSPDDIKRREARAKRAEAALRAEESKASKPERPGPMLGPNRTTIEDAQLAHKGMFKDSPKAKIAINAAAISEAAKKAMPAVGELMFTQKELTETLLSPVSSVAASAKPPANPYPGLGGPNTTTANLTTTVPTYGYGKPQSSSGPYPGVGGPNTTVTNVATNAPSYGYGKPSVGSVPYPGLGGPSTGSSSAAPAAIFDPYRDRPVTTLDSTQAPTRYSSPVGPDRGTLEAQRAKERNDLFNSLAQKPNPPRNTIDIIRSQQAEARSSAGYQDRIDAAREYRYRPSGPMDSISPYERQAQKEFYAGQRAKRAATKSDNKNPGFFSRLFAKPNDFQTNPNSSPVRISPKGGPPVGGFVPIDPYGQNRPSSVGTTSTTSATTTSKATPTGGLGSGLKGAVGGVGGFALGTVVLTAISSLKEWTKGLTTSKDGIQSFTGKVIDVGLSISEIIAPMAAYSAVQKIAEKGLGGFVQSITRLVPKLAPRALLSGAKGLATAGLGAAKGGAAAAAPYAAFAAKGVAGGLALFEGVAALSRLIKGKSITDEGGRDESFVRAAKTALDASAAAKESGKTTDRMAAQRGVSFKEDTRLIADSVKSQLDKFIVRTGDGKVAGLTDEGRRIATRTNDGKYFEAFVNSLELTGKEATEFSLALSSVRPEIEEQVKLARDRAAGQRLMIAAEADSIRSLVGFSFAVKKVSDLSAFGDSASNIASGSFRVNASELGATGDDPRRIASVARQLGATEDAIKSIQSEGERKSVLQNAKVALANSNDPAAFEAFSDTLREIVDSDPTARRDGIASENMGPEQLLAAAESVVEAQSSLKKEMIDSAKNFDRAFNQYIDSISKANEAQLSLNQALLDFGETTRSRAKDREGFSATGTTLSDIRNRRASIGPVGDGSALRAGLAATSARLTATGMGLNRDPQNAALQQTFAGLQVQQKAQMELLKQDNQLRSQLIDSIKEELALEQGRAKTFQDVNKALSGELGIDAQIQAQETARIANEAQAAVDRGDVSGAQRIISDSSMFGQNPETIKGLLRTSSREAIDLFSQKKGASLFGGGPLQRDAQFSAFGRTEQGSVLDANLVKRNQELGQNDAANIQAMNENVILLRDTANLFTQSISAMGGHMVAFGNEMRNIVASLNNASVKLTMAPANIVVTLNNAEGLATISKEMKKMVNDAIAQKFLEQQQGM